MSAFHPLRSLAPEYDRASQPWPLSDHLLRADFDPLQTLSRRERGPPPDEPTVTNQFHWR